MSVTKGSTRPSMKPKTSGAENMAVPQLDILTLDLSISLKNPKSDSFTLSSVKIRMFAGFRSRWQIYKSLCKESKAMTT